MSRLARAVEILEAIHKHFDHEGQGVLYSDAQILDGDTSIKDAIAQCLEPEPVTYVTYVPRSQQRRISRSVHTGWNGWIGPRKVAAFGSDELRANQWLNEGV